MKLKLVVGVKVLKKVFVVVMSVYGDIDLLFEDEEDEGMDSEEEVVLVLKWGEWKGLDLMVMDKIVKKKEKKEMVVVYMVELVK